MIIKSMSRKTRSFGQLIDYIGDIEKSEHKYNVYQNIYSRKPEDIESEFQENADYAKQRRNGVYLYHEILSITKAEKLDRQTQKEILRDIAYEYAQRRAQNNLVFGTLHDDHEEHLHDHLLISSNAVGDSKKTRLSKAQFDQLKKGLESEVLKNHPELEQKLVINKQAGEKLSNKGHEQKRRTGKTPQRDVLKQRLHDIFQRSHSKQGFFSALTEEGLELYYRGNSIGIQDHATGRKHRLKTLGVLDDFRALSDRIELDKEIKQARSGSDNKESEKPETKRKAKKSGASADDIQTKRTEEIKAMREKRSQRSSNSENKSGKKE